MLGLLAACQDSPAQLAPGNAVTPTLLAAPGTPRPTAVIPPTTTPRSAGFLVQVDVTSDVQPISPLIYGVSSDTLATIDMLRPTLLSWGGNPSTRYNWQHGQAWNAGRDWFYRNTNYGGTSGSASDKFVERALRHGIEVRLSVPTLGWVAKNDNENTCSFPLPNGECSDGAGANCENPTMVANPELANVRSDVAAIVAWIRHLTLTQGYKVRFVALDNEPELWGYTHYDVHPTCSTYDEVLQKYLEYAQAIREVAPEAELVGPNTCCWHFYWNSAAGPADQARHGGATFLPWFLDSVRKHDEQFGVRTLNVLDVHYYPDGVYNDDVDDATAAHRLRSTRSLWDPAYVDESWIDTPVMLIPRLRHLVEEHYPGTQVGLSEWNWGADTDITGALAIADVLGTFGREGLYYAAYWREPPAGSPGFLAFKAYTNYDDQGGRFGDLSVWSQTDDYDLVSSYAALESTTGKLHLMLVHKQPNTSLKVVLDIRGFSLGTTVAQYQISRAADTALHATTLTWSEAEPVLELPAYSVTHLVFAPVQMGE